MNTFEQFLHDSINLELYSVDAEVSAINPQFKSHKKWIKGYIGPATAELHDIKEGDYMEFEPIGTGEFKLKKV